MARDFTPCQLMSIIAGYVHWKQKKNRTKRFPNRSIPCRASTSTQQLKVLVTALSLYKPEIQILTENPVNIFYHFYEQKRCISFFIQLLFFYNISIICKYPVIQNLLRTANNSSKFIIYFMQDSFEFLLDFFWSDLRRYVLEVIYYQ